MFPHEAVIQPLWHGTDKDDGAEATALDVTDTRIFRASAKEGDKWVSSARYDMSKEKMTPLK